MQFPICRGSKHIPVLAESAILIRCGTEDCLSASIEQCGGKTLDTRFES